MIAAFARSTAIRLAVTVVILIYLARQVDLRESARALLGINPAHLIAVLALVAVDRVVMIARWVLLLGAVDTPIFLRAAARIFLVSSFVGSFLPAGIGGDAARAYSLARQTARGSDAVASVAIDRLLGLTSIAMMGALGASIWSPSGAGSARSALFWSAMAVIVATFALFWSDRLIRSVIPHAWLETGLGARFERLVLAITRYRSQLRAVILVLLLSVGVQLLRILQAYLLGRGLNIAVPFSYYLVFMPVGLLMLLLPVSVSGFGLPQGVIVWMLRPLGVPDPQSLALSTLIVLTGLAGNLPGALLYLRPKNK